MNLSPVESLEPDQLLDELVTAYLKAVEAGQAPDRQQWLAQYPQLADDLAAFFADQDRWERMTAPMRAALGPPSVTEDTPLGQGNKSGADLRMGGEAGSFGDYELLAEIGRGGMGIVYKARQGSLGRVVALKMLRGGNRALAADVHRFRVEAEAAAGLDHPHIVPIYEIGTLEGQAYFSMKLLSGGNLANAAVRDQKPGLGKEARRRAAQWVATTARAVHHAHRRGILHRDLKPSNILLDAEGRPHVTDFGLAKRVEVDSSLTESGVLVGTPSYMAPEQATGKKGAITTATDIYGLGAVLYALIAGQPPFRGDTVLETLEQIKQREPEPPTKSKQQVDQDLQTICLKCLEREPERRYGSAEALADDLERWLAGEPIRARPISRAARLWRWCRRNRVLAGLTATLAVIVPVAIAGLAITTSLIWQEKKQTEFEKEQTKNALAEAQANYTLAEAQRRRAETNFREAYWTIEELLWAFGPDQHSQPMSAAELKQFQTERALRFFAPFCEDPSDEPAVRLQKGAAYVHTGRVYQVLGERDKAQKAFHQAVAVFARLVQDFPDDPTYPHELATALRILADDLYQAGQLADANGYYRKAVRIWREALRNHRAGLEAYLRLATVQCLWFDSDLRDPTAALQLAQKAVEMAPRDPQPKMIMGIAYYQMNRWSAALNAFQEAFQKASGWDRKWPWTPSFPSLFFFAMAQSRCGKHAEALESYQKAVRLMAKIPIARADPYNCAIRAEAAAVLEIQEPPAAKVEEKSAQH
jgi:tetratricopeptide (TPR) repeat protein